jgi:ectoine hydroxylase-related dioxygenase (phytanoyl-CoA dioxygenase family)
MGTLTTANVVAPRLADLTVPAPSPGPADWNDDGLLIIEGAIDDERIDAYRRCWEHENRAEGFDIDHGSPAVLHAVRPGGWPDCTPYMRHPEILDLVAPLAGPLASLIGEPAGLHLNLTGWVTTERDWHQDSYLNEPEVGDHYAAIWVALDDIDPASGPFQYVPGSHRWPQVTRERIAPYVDLADPQWPKHSEAILSPLFDAEIARRGAEVVTHLPRRGDVLIWHGRLLHRGSKAQVPGAYRPAFIAHFSGIAHRPAMPAAVEHAGGGWYFPLGGPSGMAGNV